MINGSVVTNRRTASPLNAGRTCAPAILCSGRVNRGGRKGSRGGSQRVWGSSHRPFPELLDRQVFWPNPRQDAQWPVAVS